MLFLGLNEIVLKNLYSSFFLIKSMVYESAIRVETEQLRSEHMSLTDSYDIMSQRYTEVTHNLDTLRMKRLFRVLDFVMSSRKQESFIYLKVHRRN